MTGRHLVIGAGWTGLAAATFLQDQGLDVTVVEAAAQVGGRIATTRHGGFVVEHGPHAVLDKGAAVARLMEASGLEFVAAPADLPRFMVHLKRLHRLPTSPPAILRSRLLGPLGRLRLLAEPLVPKARQDESVARLARRRLGRSAADAVDAFVTGVHAGDPDRLSARHATPALWRMDQQGGILRDLVKARSGRRSQLMAPVDGMQEWMQALARRLDVRTSTPVTEVGQGGVQTGHGWMEAERVLICTDAPASADLLHRRTPPPPVAPVTVVALAVEDAGAPEAGYGALAPEAAGCHFLGALYESCLFPGRAPDGRALLRVLVGGRRHPQRAHWPSVRERVLTELRDLHIVRGDVEEVAVVPTQGIPQLELGHGAWADGIGPDVAGMGHRAVGLAALAEEAAAVARAAVRVGHRAS